MADSELLNLSQRNKPLNDGLTARTIPDMDRKSNKTFKTKETYYVEDIRQTSQSGGTLLGAEHIFRIQRSEMFTRDKFLEIPLGDAAVLDVGKMCGYSMIDLVTINQGRDLNNYSGEVLNQIVHTINTDSDMKKHLALIGGGEGADIGGQVLIIPILCPGSNCVFKGYSDIGQRPFWPIGKCSSDLIIKIKFKTQAEIDVNSAITINAPILRYTRAKKRGDFGTPKTQAGEQIIFDTIAPYVLEKSPIIETVVATNTTVYQLSDLCRDGDIQWIGFHRCIDANYDTAKEYFVTQEIPQADLKLKGQTLYSHSSTNEAISKHVRNFKEINKWGNTTNPTYYYNMPISANFAWDVKNIGSPGANFKIETPTLEIVEPASDTIRTKIFVLYKCKYTLFSNQTVREILTLK